MQVEAKIVSLSEQDLAIINSRLGSDSAALLNKVYMYLNSKPKP